ncbi:MAG: hypothetical protein Q4G02_01775 [bacterium]|nr:hypothetical protein [bacterium]
MKKIIANYYLLAICGLIVQAVLVVFSGNVSIATNLEIKKVQADNQEITNRLRILEDEISGNTSAYQLTTENEFADLVPIDKREVVSHKNLASLP